MKEKRRSALSDQFSSSVVHARTDFRQTHDSVCLTKQACIRRKITFARHTAIPLDPREKQQLVPGRTNYASAQTNKYLLTVTVDARTHAPSAHKHFSGGEVWAERRLCRVPHAVTADDLV